MIYCDIHKLFRVQYKKEIQTHLHGSLEYQLQQLFLWRTRKIRQLDYLISLSIKLASSKSQGIFVDILLPREIETYRVVN